MAYSLRVLALAIWFGGGLAVLYGTRAIFSAAESRKQAGHFSGAVLASFRWLQLAAGLLFLAAALSGASRLWGWLALVLSAAGFFVDRSLRALRAELGGSTEGLDAQDPRRKRWGTLHGASVLLLIGQVLAAAIGLIA